MYQFCFEIGGQRHCFDVPTLIDKNLIRRPPPNNLPPFELAVSVLQLIEAVPQSRLSSELSEIANRYIQQFAKTLPKNIELIPAKQAVSSVTAQS
jgi:hypothetical protein